MTYDVVNTTVADIRSDVHDDWILVNRDEKAAHLVKLFEKTNSETAQSAYGQLTPDDKYEMHVAVNQWGSGDHDDALFTAMAKTLTGTQMADFAIADYSGKPREATPRDVGRIGKAMAALDSGFNKQKLDFISALVEAKSQRYGLFRGVEHPLRGDSTSGHSIPKAADPYAVAISEVWASMKDQPAYFDVAYTMMAAPNPQRETQHAFTQCFQNSGIDGGSTCGEISRPFKPHEENLESSLNDVVMGSTKFHRDKDDYIRGDYKLAKDIAEGASHLSNQEHRDAVFNALIRAHDDASMPLPTSIELLRSRGSGPIEL